MENFKNILIRIYNWIFGRHIGEDVESNYIIDLELAKDDDSIMSNEIFIEINKYRVSNGLSLVKKGNVYSYAYAVEHTKYMIGNKKISHDWYGIRREGLKFRGAKRVGEIVAFGYNSAGSVVNAWLNSPDHKSIIDGNFTHTGFGVLKDDSGKYYYTELFYHDNS